jgi:5-methylcytosine-specific restriction endonuclease McrA
MVIENLGERELCKSCIHNLPKFMKKQFAPCSKKQNKKDKKRDRFKQIAKLPKHSERPDTIDYSYSDWPVSTKTGGRMSYNYIKSDAFLKSFEWRKVRMAALANNEAVCECCGARAKDEVVLNVDHIKPRKYFPHLALTLENLQVLCADCNAGKGNDYQINWREHFRSI